MPAPQKLVNHFLDKFYDSLKKVAPGKHPRALPSKAEASVYVF